MEIIVCVKQVPDTAEVMIDPETNTLIRQGIPSIVNPFDKNAVEAALVLREKHGAKVTVISMGPPQTTEALKECLAMGADTAVLISDRVFGGADTLATSYTLAAAIKKIASFDIIICGKQAIDGDTAQVGPEIAEHLGIAQVTYVSKIDSENDYIRVEREREDGYEVVDVKAPVLLSVVKSINQPRLPTVKAMLKAKRTEIPVWSVQDLNVDAEKIGLKGSPTQVRKIFTPPRRANGIFIKKETAQEAVAELIQKLTDAKVM
jgi:electron transfer flavoprotein alpha/beta subunit